MRRLILGVALLAIIAGAAILGFAAGGHATSAPAAAPVYLYWANSTAGRGAPWAKRPAATSIGRARLDGTGVEHSFVSGTGRGPCGVALDGTHIYWAERQGGKVGRPDKGGAIGRGNRDGSGVNASFIPTPGAHDCGVAIAGSQIYWASEGCTFMPVKRNCVFVPGTSSASASIGRANVDGTSVDRQFITGIGSPCGIAVAGKYIYWTNNAASKKPVTIGRANLDGTGVNKRFITGVKAGCGIAVIGGDIYWTNAGFTDRPAIGRANLDGTGVNQGFIRTASTPCGVAVYQGHIYWGEWTGRFADDPSTTIGRANLNGSAVNNQFITGIHDYCGGLAVG
jgi:hypothetical protein